MIGTPGQPDPVVQALEVAARILRNWSPRPGLLAGEEWDPSPFLPGGDRYIPKLVTYGTPVSPTTFYRIRSREEIAADERREAAGKVLAVLRKPRDSDVSRRMSGQPCGSCVLGAVPRLLPFGFPLAVAGTGG